MDKKTQLNCIRLYDDVLSSRIGTSILDYFYENDENKNYYNFFFEIKKKLLENKYNNPKEWFYDQKKKIINISKNFGINSDISLCLLTFIQILEEKIDQITKFDLGSIYERVSMISDRIEDQISLIPNNFEDFLHQIEKFEDNKEIYIYKPKNVEKYNNINIDPLEIYHQIQLINDDEKLQSIIDIITGYEPTYSHEHNVIEFDLSKCEKYTLYLIQNYLKNINLF